MVPTRPLLHGGYPLLPAAISKKKSRFYGGIKTGQGELLVLGDKNPF